MKSQLFIGSYLHPVAGIIWLCEFSITEEIVWIGRGGLGLTFVLGLDTIDRFQGGGVIVEELEFFGMCKLYGFVGNMIGKKCESFEDKFQDAAGL